MSLLLKGLGLILMGSALVLQPGDRPSQPSTERVREPGQSATREGVRTRLSKRLAESERNAELLRLSIARLDGGEDPEAISRELDRAQRSARESRDAGRHSGKQESLTDEQRRELMSVLRDTMPTVASRFEQLRRQDPQAAERLTARLLPRVREAMESRESDPELFLLRMDELRSMSEVMAAAQELRSHAGPESEKEPLRVALRGAIGRQFDARHASDLREITKLQGRVAELQEEARRKLENRDSMIEAFSKKFEKEHDGSDRRP